MNLDIGKLNAGNARRAKLDKQIADYLSNGGVITEVENGVSSTSTKLVMGTKGVPVYTEEAKRDGYNKRFGRDIERARS